MLPQVIYQEYPIAYIPFLSRMQILKRMFSMLTMNALRLFLLVLSLCFWYEASAQRTPSETSGEALFNSAKDLSELKLYGAAGKEFNNYLQKRLLMDDMRLVEAQYQQVFSALQLFHPDAGAQLEHFTLQHSEQPQAKEAFYQAGHFYYQQKQYEKALAYLPQAVKGKLPEPKQSEALFELGYSYLSQKLFTKADSAFSAIRNQNFKYAAAANYYSAYLKVKNGQYEQALPKLDAADKDAQFKAMTPLLRAIIHYRKKEYETTISVGTKALQDTAKVNSPEEIALLVGEAFYAQGKYTDAAPYYEQYAKKGSGFSPSLRFRMGYAFFKTAKYPLAIEQFKPLTQVKADSVQKRDSLVQFAAYYLGGSYLNNGNETFALAAFDQARKMKALSILKELSWFSYAKLCFQERKFDESITEFESFLKAYPKANDAPEAADLLGEAYLNTTDFDKALKHIEQLPKRSPRIERAYQRAMYLKGSQYFNESNYPQAIVWLEKAVRFETDEEATLGAYYWLAEAYAEEKQYAKALDAYSAFLASKGVEESALKWKGIYGKAYAYFNSRQYAKALPLFEQYVKQFEKAENPQNYGDARLRMADCLFATKKFEEALKTYQRTIAQSLPDADYAAYQRGVVYAFQGNRGQARIAFNELLRDFPTTRFKEEAQFQLANIAFEAGDYNQAVTDFNALLKAKPSEKIIPYILLKRGNAYANLKDNDKAIADFKKILTDYPNAEQARLALLNLQEQVGSSGNVEEFDGFLAKFKEANPEDNSTEKIEYETSKGLYFNQKYAKAIGGFETFLKSYPKSAFSQEVKFYLAESYFRTGEKAKSLALHNEVASDEKGAFLTRAYTRVAEINLSDGKADTALLFYKKLQQAGKNKKEQLIASTGIMEAFFLNNQADSARVYAEKVLASSPPVDFENRASLMLGKVEFALNNYDAAIDNFLTTLNGAKDIYGAEANYLLAEALYKKGQYKTSLEKCINLTKNFANYTKWYDKAFLLVADNYIALKEDYQAKFTLNNIIEKSKNKELIAEASKRLELLKAK